MKQKEKLVSYLCLVVFFSCVIAKFFLGSVSIEGDSIYSLMTADYWNFGKDLLNGKLAYVDIVDHKGVYLYWIYSVMIFLSNNSIAIVPYIEMWIYVATIASFCYTIQHKKEKDWYVVLFSIIYLLGSVGVTLINTEGLALPFVFLIWKYVQEKEETSPIPFLLIGIVLGFLFNLKITSIVLFFPMFAYLCCKHFKHKHSVVVFAKSIAMGLLGFVGINIPFTIYLLANDNLDTFLQIYKVTILFGGDMPFTLLLLSFLLLGFALYCYYKRKVDICNMLVLLSTMCMYYCFGDTPNYYFLIYSGLLLLSALQKEKINYLLLLFVCAICFGIGFKNTHDFYQYQLIVTYNQQKIAEQYEIDNSNILYIWEDMGYGVYSDKPYQEPLQWLPIKMLYSDAFKEYYVNLTIERLENQTYKYVHTLPPTAFEMTNIAYENKEYSEKEMEVVETYLLIEDTLNEYYTPCEDNPWLYVAK